MHICMHMHPYPHMDPTDTIDNSIYKGYCISFDLLFQPLSFTFLSVFFTCLKARSSCFGLNKKIPLIFLFH